MHGRGNRPIFHEERKRLRLYLDCASEERVQPAFASAVLLSTDCFVKDRLKVLGLTPVEGRPSCLWGVSLV